jgi:hypothetical protein
MGFGAKGVEGGGVVAGEEVGGAAIDFAVRECGRWAAEDAAAPGMRGGFVALGGGRLRSEKFLHSREDERWLCTKSDEIALSYGKQGKLSCCYFWSADEGGVEEQRCGVWGGIYLVEFEGVSKKRADFAWSGG